MSQVEQEALRPPASADLRASRPPPRPAPALAAESELVAVVNLDCAAEQLEAQLARVLRARSSLGAAAGATRDASQQACVKEAPAHAAVARLDARMERLRALAARVLHEQLLRHALLTASPGGPRGCGCAEGPPGGSGDSLPVRAGAVAGRCVVCGARAGCHHRLAQTTAADHPPLADARALTALLQEYEREHEAIAEELRGAVARMKEAAGGPAEPVHRLAAPLSTAPAPQPAPAPAAPPPPQRSRAAGWWRRLCCLPTA